MWTADPICADLFTMGWFNFSAHDDIHHHQSPPLTMFINECRHIWFPLLADWFTILCWSLSSIATIIAKANVILASSVRGVCMYVVPREYVEPFRITQSVVKSSQLQRKIDFLAARLVNRLCISLEGALVIAQLDCCCHCWGWLAVHHPLPNEVCISWCCAE